MKNHENTNYFVRRVAKNVNFHCFCISPNEIPIISWNGYYINNFCVDMDYRREGHGSFLINKVINIARNEQKDHLILQVDDKNNSAKQLYYKMGFTDYFKGSDENNNMKLFLVKYL